MSYAVRYTVINRRGEIVTKEITRSSEKALYTAANRIEKQSSFVEFTAWSFPSTMVPVSSEQAARDRAFAAEQEEIERAKAVQRSHLSTSTKE
jgi:hypothetical protein